MALTLYEGRECWIMKITSSKLVVLTAILMIAFSSACRAGDASRVDISKGTLQAKIEYCTLCHGVSGQGYRGFFPMPRLAGQQAEYFGSQLLAFIERRRGNRYMLGVARSLSPAMRAALARHFQDLNPKPLGGAPRQLVATGKKIYEEGTPETNVPACMACHGAEAKGQGSIPRLAGQLHDYISSKLVNWNKERGQDAAKPDISAIMLPTSHNLTRPQIAAVAAYVSYLK
jgi:cytochrome c553